MRGRWIFGSKGEPHDYSCDALRFGLQPSGLAWDGELLWAVSDQSSSCPGCLFSFSPSSRGSNRDALFLEEDGLRIVHQGRALVVDAEGITLLDDSPGDKDELVFAVVMEDGFERHLGWATDERSPGAALVIRVNRDSRAATVSAIWRFELPAEKTVRPYKGDRNRRFEGIAVDRSSRRGYLAYEQDESGSPRLFTFELPPIQSSPGTEELSVLLEEVSFDIDSVTDGTPGTENNFNDLAYLSPNRLLVLCRDRELLLVLDLIDPKTAELAFQIPLDLRSPLNQAIEWASPEGIAIDEETNTVFIVSDPDPRCGGNWKAAAESELDTRQRLAEAFLFSQFVPLLFEFELSALGENFPIKVQ
jgi:hypothetical protein